MDRVYALLILGFHFLPPAGRNDHLLQFFHSLLLAVYCPIFWLIKLATDRLGIPFWDSAVCVQSHCQFAVY